MRQKQTSKMIICAMMMAMTTLIILILPIPLPTGNGYINLGDGMILTSVVILGRKYGAVAGGLGAALADLLLGFSIWAPFTFFIKGVMIFLIGTIVEKGRCDGKSSKAVFAVAALLGGIWMVAGYFIVAGILYGSFAVAALSIPMDCLQFAIGVLFSAALLTALNKTPVGKHFTYHLK